MIEGGERERGGRELERGRGGRERIIKIHNIRRRIRKWKGVRSIKHSIPKNGTFTCDRALH